MKIAYFDCINGASGDMILGALIAAGVQAETLEGELAGIKLAGYELAIRQVSKQGFAATKVDVKMTGKPGHRHLHHIVDIIDASALAEGVKDFARRVFTRLAEAEARVHGTTIEKVHFHEVGAVDAIVDIVGAAIGLDVLAADRVVVSPLPVGSGTVKCEHGVMPVPAPATVELLKGAPVAATDEPGELLTPTGAAILTTIADAYGPLPAIRVSSQGFGAGSRDGVTRPNVLRLVVGEAVDGSTTRDAIVVLEANIDDSTGEEIGHAIDRVLAAGALDVFATPIVMKKSRPGVMLTALCDEDKRQDCEAAIFAHTTTFGIRSYCCDRTILARRVETLKTRYGPIRVKLGLDGDRVRIVSPEYDDCARAAERAGVSLRTVMDETRRVRAAQEGGEGSP